MASTALAFQSEKPKRTPRDLDGIAQVLVPSPNTATYKLHVHAVLIMVGSDLSSDPANRPTLESTFSNVCGTNGAELMQILEFDDQVHLLIEYPATLAVTDLLIQLKSSMPTIHWCPSFFVGSCGHPDLKREIKRFLKAK
jgi:hypothetical protein